ncbi:inosine triphosphate pyrophosphatase-like protein [Dactylonectria estremocensis]|uniref:inosine/xanthosine triphosphatase n=1 Tax=Dactylonectria estremocensis TaxID=1079267 RepID=A0A9P9EMC4_9HYPO|nr:inosine triphosphate pyrophosphatase-like protein [Dactylonectria estremocensis]
MSAPKKTIVVSSKNPIKIKAALEGFKQLLPAEYEITGVSVPSGVPEQPFSDQETLLGAMNRVQNVREVVPDADYWVGIEGGVEERDGSILNFAWIVVSGRHGRTGKARTASYALPEETAELLRKGMELGHADDAVFGRVNSKQSSGSVGLLTDDVVDRAGFYTPAVVLALIPFKNTNLTFK